MLKLAEFETKQIIKCGYSSNQMPINFTLQICNMLEIQENVKLSSFFSLHQANGTPLINPKSTPTKLFLNNSKKPLVMHCITHKDSRESLFQQPVENNGRNHDRIRADCW